MTSLEQIIGPHSPLYTAWAKTPDEMIIQLDSKMSCAAQISGQTTSTAANAFDSLESVPLANAEKQSLTQRKCFLLRERIRQRE